MLSNYSSLALVTLSHSLSRSHWFCLYLSISVWSATLAKWCRGIAALTAATFLYKYCTFRIDIFKNENTDFTSRNCLSLPLNCVHYNDNWMNVAFIPLQFFCRVFFFWFANKEDHPTRMKWTKIDRHTLTQNTSSIKKAQRNFHDYLHQNHSNEWNEIKCAHFFFICTVAQFKQSKFISLSCWFNFN